MYAEHIRSHTARRGDDDTESHSISGSQLSSNVEVDNVPHLGQAYVQLFDILKIGDDELANILAENGVATLKWFQWHGGRPPECFTMPPQLTVELDDLMKISGDELGKKLWDAGVLTYEWENKVSTFFRGHFQRNFYQWKLLYIAVPL